MLFGLFVLQMKIKTIKIGYVVFGYSPEGESIILRLSEVVRLSFTKLMVDNPLSDCDHYDNPLN